jgi:DNA-binding MarR family transcriptional regulator
MIEQTPGITRLLDKLEKGGWVTRNRSKDDRRQVLCSISVRGRKLLDELDASIDAVPEQLFADIPDHEAKVLVRVLDKIRATHFEKVQHRDDANSAA